MKLGLFFLVVSNFLVAVFDYDRAVSNAQRGDLETAAQIMSSLMVDDPDNEQLMYDMGVLAYQKGEFEESSAYFGRIEELPNVSKQLKEKAYFNRGNAFVHSSKLYKALAEYQKALSLNPENERAKSNYERVKQMIDDQEKDQDGKDKNSDQEQSSNRSQAGTDPQFEKNSAESKQNERESGESNNQQNEENGESSDHGQDDRGDNKRSDQKCDNQEKDQQKRNKERTDKHKQDKKRQEERVPEKNKTSEYDAQWGKDDQLSDKPEADEHESSLEKGEINQHSTPSEKQQNYNTHDMNKDGVEQEGADIHENLFEQLDLWAKHLLQERDKEDCSLNKKMIQATVNKKTTGSHENHCW